MWSNCFCHVGNVMKSSICLDCSTKQFIRWPNTTLLQVSRTPVSYVFSNNKPRQHFNITGWIHMISGIWHGQHQDFSFHEQASLERSVQILKEQSRLSSHQNYVSDSRWDMKSQKMAVPEESIYILLYVPKLFHESKGLIFWSKFLKALMVTVLNGLLYYHFFVSLNTPHIYVLLYRSWYIPNDPLWIMLLFECLF